MSNMNVRQLEHISKMSATENNEFNFDSLSASKPSSVSIKRKKSVKLKNKSLKMSSLKKNSLFDSEILSDELHSPNI